MEALSSLFTTRGRRQTLSTCSINRLRSSCHLLSSPESRSSRCAVLRIQREHILVLTESSSLALVHLTKSCPIRRDLSSSPFSVQSSKSTKLKPGLHRSERLPTFASRLNIGSADIAGKRRSSSTGMTNDASSLQACGLATFVPLGASLMSSKWTRCQSAALLVVS